ncbi:MAG TPA: FtsX-like permease family protein, partial [Candidatus Solibacter sp.]|nr:FtsX-like permease family protein [Candidatus Solibacter sp.]
RAVILASKVDAVPGATGYTNLRDQFRRPLMVLLWTTGLVLLIACANFANLLLVRGSARAKEIALRFAIGAGRRRIVRQLLTESLMLGTMGAALGLALASAGSRMLVAMLSSGRRDPIALDLAPDLTMLAFTSAAAVVTGILFGLAPALRATAAGPGVVLKSSTGVTSRASGRLLAPVVVFQVAVSMVLLIGAGLFVRTLQNLQHVHAGFRHEGVLLVNVDGQRAGYKGPGLTAFYRSLMERLSRLPGVRSASASGNTPLSGGIWTDDVTVGDRKAHAHFNTVSPGYFATMGTPLIAGRDFNSGDEDGSRNVCIVSQAFAKALGGIGSQVLAPGAKAPVEVVGIVGDTVSQSLREKAPPTIYSPYFREGSRISIATIELRVQGSLTQVADLVRKEIRSALPRTATQAQVQGLTEQVERTLMQERLLAALGSAFGVLALVLAAVGLYGLLAYTVSRATSEIGIRMALGAQRGEVVWMVLRGALRLIAIGVVVGAPAGWAASRVVASALFGLEPGDPTTITAAAILLAGTAMAAAWIPARRASRVDPMVALRWE